MRSRSMVVSNLLSRLRSPTLTPPTSAQRRRSASHSDGADDSHSQRQTDLAEVQKSLSAIGPPKKRKRVLNEGWTTAPRADWRVLRSRYVMLFYVSHSV